MKIAQPFCFLFALFAIFALFFIIIYILLRIVLNIISCCYHFNRNGVMNTKPIILSNMIRIAIIFISCSKFSAFIISNSKWYPIPAFWSCHIISTFNNRIVFNYFILFCKHLLFIHRIHF